MPWEIRKADPATTMNRVRASQRNLRPAAAPLSALGAGPPRADGIPGTHRIPEATSPPSTWLRKPSSLSALAKEALRARIITGEIGRDHIYSVPSLAADFGVSATPVREAMVELVNEGLFEVVANQGFRVLAPTEHDLDEIFQIRLMLEVPAMTEVARSQLTAEQVASFRELAAGLEAEAQHGGPVEFLGKDRDFHLGLLETLGNRRLVEIVAQLRDHTRLVGIPALLKSGELLQTAHEHAALIDALTAHDVEASAQLMTHHIEHTRGIWADRSDPAPATSSRLQVRPSPPGERVDSPPGVKGAPG